MYSRLLFGGAVVQLQHTLGSRACPIASRITVPSSTFGHNHSLQSSESSRFMRLARECVTALSVSSSKVRGTFNRNISSFDNIALCVLDSFLLVLLLFLTAELPNLTKYWLRMASMSYSAKKSTLQPQVPGVTNFSNCGLMWCFDFPIRKPCSAPRQVTHIKSQASANATPGGCHRHATKKIKNWSCLSRSSTTQLQVHLEKDSKSRSLNRALDSPARVLAEKFSLSARPDSCSNLKLC